MASLAEKFEQLLIELESTFDEIGLDYHRFRELLFGDGDLSDLATVDKSSFVAAVNEVVAGRASLKDEITADIEPMSASLQELYRLVADAEESDDIAALSASIQALADRAPEVTQAELDAEAQARSTADGGLSNRIGAVEARALYVPAKNVPNHPVVEGLPYVAYGASYEGSNVLNTTNETRFTYRVPNRLRMNKYIWAVGGDEAADMYMHMSQLNSARKLPPRPTGVIHVGGVLNDALRPGIFRKEGYKNSMKASLYRLCASALQYSNDAAVVKTGTWLATQTPFIGGGFNAAMNFQQTTTQDAAIQFTLTGRDLAIFTLDLATPGYAAPAAPFEIWVDGGLHDYVTPTFMAKSGSTQGFSAGGRVIPLLNLPGDATTPHTIKLYNKPSGGANSLAVVEAISIDRNFLPTIVMNRGWRPDPARPLAAPGDAANVALFESYLDEVFSEIAVEAPWIRDKILTYDVRNFGFDPALHIGSDNLHMGDRGHAVFADAEIATIMGLDWRVGQNKAV